MADWADDVASSEIIWIRASVSNKRIFYDYDDAVFNKSVYSPFHALYLTKVILGDERLRNFPFPTRRPVSDS